MNSLIRRFNEIQEINKELRIEEIRLPQIVVIGSQSSGKSSVLESIVGSDFFPKGKGMITRCPLRLELINGCVGGSEFEARFDHKDIVLTSHDAISREIKKETNRRTTNAKSITEEELVLEIMGPQFPTLTLVDLPGLIQNLEIDQPKDLEFRIKELMRKYIEPDNSIILAVSPANVDLATSEIIKYAKEVDPQGHRTIHVLTKMDIMNEGENAQDPLNCEYLRQSVAVIGVINRNEKDVQQSMSLKDQRSKEDKFFLEKYPALASNNGTMYLIKILEKVLTQAILRFIPAFEIAVKNNIRKYEKELKIQDPAEKKSIINGFMVDFYKMYRRTLKGNLESYSDKLEGGALISTCLYQTFISNMTEVNVSHLTEEHIYRTVKNTIAVKDITFSFEKPFKHLIRQEIPKFKEPSNACINEVEERLHEFVDQVLEKVELFEYPKVAEAIKGFAYDIIKERSEKCRVMIMDYITSEIKDITFTNPYTDILLNIRNYPVVSKHDDKMENTIMTPRMIKSTVNLIGLKLPLATYYPHITMAIAAFGLSSKLNEAYSNGKLNEVINIVNDVINQDIGLETLSSKISVDLGANMENFMRVFKADFDIKDDNASKERIQNTQVIIIKNIITLYFEMVRKNIINYVPKTIQTFLVKEISDKIERRIQYENSRQFLDSLIYNSDDSMRIENLKNDLEKSLIMRDKLKELRSIIN